MSTTHDGFLAGDLGTGKITFSATRATGEAVNTYDITPAADDAGTGLLGNYNVTLNHGTFTISDKFIPTVTVVRPSGSDTPTGTIVWTRVGTGDFGGTAPCTLASTVSGTATCSAIYTPTTVGTGTHTVIATYSGDANFASLGGTKGVTVNKAALSVTASNQTKINGSAFTFLGTEFTTSGLVNSDAVTSVTLTSAGAAGTAAKASYDIVASAAAGTGLSNYDITYVKATFTVNAKGLDITAKDQTKVYGTVFTFLGTEFTTSGLVNSDTVTSVTLTSAGAAGTAAASSYDIVATAAAGTGLSNYTITYHNGTLTINKADQTITFGALADKHMGDADFSVSASACSSLAVTFTTTTPTVCNVTMGGLVHLVAIGTCTIAAHQNGNGNYNSAADVSRSFNVLTHVNQPPVITEGASTSVNTTVNTQLNLTLHATDADGDTLTWSISSNGIHGTAITSGTGPSKVITYTPDLGYAGTESFIVTVNDGHGGTATITVQVTITAVEPPTYTIYLPIIIR